MSNPVSSVSLTDTLPQFLARTNQWGEPNRDLIQQKFNKRPGDGSISPGIPATESNGRAAAQWPNLVDDFMLEWFRSGAAQAIAQVASPQQEFSTISDTPVQVNPAAVVPNTNEYNRVFATVYGRVNAAPADGVFLELEGLYFEDSGVTLFQPVSKTTVYTSGGSLTTATADLIIVGGSAVHVQITGEAATVIDWNVRYRAESAFG